MRYNVPNGTYRGGFLKKSIQSTLALSPLFKNIDDRTLSAVLNTDGISVREIQKSGIIYSENCFSQKLGIIVKGSAVVEKTSGSKKVIMSTLEKGAIFGMAALFSESKKYPTVITAEKDCTVVFFTKEWLSEAFSQAPQITENYISILSAKIHFLTDKIEALSAERGTSKLYAYILDEYEKHGENGRVTLKYNMSELSRVLGIGRTTLYRELDELVSENIIEKKGKTIFLR